MIIISDYSEKINNGITIILSNEKICCPICSGGLKPHGKCLRKVVLDTGTEVLSIRVMYCAHCQCSHRVLPDKIIPYKRHSADTFAQIYDTPADKLTVNADERTIRRIRAWVAAFLAFAADLPEIIARKIGCVIQNSGKSTTLSKLTCFVKVVVNSNKWKFSVLPLTPRQSVIL